jgi:hypothetical protein
VRKEVTIEENNFKRIKKSQGYISVRKKYKNSRNSPKIKGL